MEIGRIICHLLEVEDDKHTEYRFDDWYVQIFYLGLVKI